MLSMERERSDRINRRLYGAQFGEVLRTESLVKIDPNRSKPLLKPGRSDWLPGYHWCPPFRLGGTSLPARSESRYSMYPSNAPQW